MFKVGTDTEIPSIRIDWKSEPVHCMNVEEEEDSQPWYCDIVQFLKYQKYPDHASGNDKKIIRRLSTSFYLDGEILYKKTRDQVLLRCVAAKEAQRIMGEVHEGVCGTHACRHLFFNFS